MARPDDAIDRRHARRGSGFTPFLNSRGGAIDPTSPASRRRCRGTVARVAISFICHAASLGWRAILDSTWRTSQGHSAWRLVALVLSLGRPATAQPPAIRYT